MGEKGGFQREIEGVEARTDARRGGGDDQAALDLGPMPPAGGDVAPAFPVARPSSGGRPKGALNRKTVMLKRYFGAKGFRDPAVLLGEIISADPIELLNFFRKYDPPGQVTSLFEVSKFIRDAAVAAMPYLHSKMPQQLDLGTDKMAVMLIGGGDRTDDEIAEDVLSIEDGIIDDD